MLSFLFQLSTSSTNAVSPGALDSSFGGTGKVRTGFGGGFEAASAAAVQIDGKLILAGFGNTRYSQPLGYANGGDFLMVRLGTNNLLDPSFGEGGKVFTQVSTYHPSSASSVINAVKLQADGKIVAAGYSYQNTNYTDFTVARYNPDGSLDTTFGTNGTGIAHTDFGEISQINALQIQSDGRIVVAGYVSSGGPSGVALARYTTNGMLDTSFGFGGIAVTPGIYCYANALLIQNDGKIVTAGVGIAPGDAREEFALFRYTTNGALDSSFGSGGKVYTRISPVPFSYSGSANAIALQFGGVVTGSEDKIVVAGEYTDENVSPFRYYQAVVRYHLDGSLDTSFGNNGIVTNSIIQQSPWGQICTSLLVLTPFLGPVKIIIGGWGQDGTSYLYSLAQLTGTGALDTTFGANNSGTITIPLGASADYVEAEANALVYQSGQYVLAGTRAIFTGDSDFAAMRFTSSGHPDASFGTNGFLQLDITDAPGAQANAVAVQPDGKVVVAGVSPQIYDPFQNTTTTDFALVRYNPDGSLDSSFANTGKIRTSIATNDVAQALAIQPDGKIVAAGRQTGGFALARYHVDGSLDASFGNGGKVAVPVGAGNGGQGYAMRLQPDGKILVAGGADDSSGALRFGIARFNTNGTLDASFGSGGFVVTSFESPPSADLAYAVDIQAGGKITAAGMALQVVSSTLSASFAVDRYNTNGGLDFSFGTLGRTTGNVGGGTLDAGYAMAIQPDGRIVVAGTAGLGGIPGAASGNQSVNAFLVLVRFNTNGSLDATFGSGGSVLTQVGSFSDFATALALQPDGKMLVVGASQNGSYQWFALRYNSDGSVDNSFGNNGDGATFLDFGSGTNEIAYGMAFDSSGRALLAGDAGGGTFGVARIFAYSVTAPTLKISLTRTNTAIVSWPYPSSGWSLQQNSNLNSVGGGGGWITPPQTVNNDGTSNFIIINPLPPTGNAFYRLRGS